MPALILPLKKHTAWWIPAHTRTSNAWQFIVSITNVHPSPHPFSPSLKLNLTTWRQFSLIATAPSSAGSACQSLPFQCAVARATVWRARFCVATCIFGSWASIPAPAAGMDLTPSSPGAACPSSQPLASSYFSADRRLHEKDRGCCNALSPETFSSAGLHLEEVRGFKLHCAHS